jgi:predicted RNA binding protein YcfA (HicA-like mRNA interferase family)
MSKWQKLLTQMVNDTNPTGYTYDEAALVLRNLGFTLAARGATSHRKWARRDDQTTIVITLVEKGSGPLKAYLIRDMIKQLRDNGIIPPTP